MTLKPIATAGAALLALLACTHFASAGENLRLVLNERPDVPLGGINPAPQTPQTKNLLLTDDDEAEDTLIAHRGGWGGHHGGWGGHHGGWGWGGWRGGWAGHRG